MDWTEFSAQWLHIFFGVFWFGSVLFADFILLPAIMTLPGERQPQVITAISERADRVIPFVATGAIVLGIMRGTILGPIKDVADLGSAYGVYFLIGLIAAIATFAWGYFAAEQRKQFARASVEWAGAGGAMPAALVAQRDRIRPMVLVELVGFAVVFTTMILMHFAGEA